MLKQLSLCFIAVFISINLHAQSTEYSRAKILLNTHTVNELSRLGIDISEGEYRKGYSFTSDFSADEIKRIQQAGFTVELLIKNVNRFYKDQNNNKTGEKVAQVATASCGISAPDYPVPAHFTLGSMGGYFTYDEMLALLDSMAAQYPNLITVKQPIGATQTIEGRSVFYVKISDNPNINEPEPEVLYTAVHHAREPGGLSQLIYYMYYLLENYATNPAIQALVNNTEMYFVPCVNPDGYIYNETTDPNGGGLWRKNRRDNLDGTYGVDLNRNYGYNWGYDDMGSSPNTVDQNYRGTAAFSEPETQLLSGFVNTHDFKLAFNYHTYSNLLIYPWGYEPNIYTPDSALFDNYGQLLTRFNGYKFGTGNQTVNYITNGTSDDWMYGDQLAKPKVFAMTPEVGEVTWGFWAPSSEIIRHCKANMFPNLTLARLAGKYGTAHDESPIFLTSAIGYLKFNFRQLGLDTTGTFSISIVPVNSVISSVGSPKSFSNLSTLQLLSDSISFALNTSAVPGDAVQYTIAINNGLYTVYSDTITKYYGAPTQLVTDNGTTMSHWLTGTQWGVDNTFYYSPGSSISDSPNNLSFSGTTNPLILSGQVSLGNALHAMLSYYARWEIETLYDYAQVFISTNNGNSWIPLCGKYTHPSGNNFVLDQPVYDGFHAAWVREEINLDDYIGQNITIKFEMTTDGFNDYDGFYFDDFNISVITPTGINNPHSNTTFVSNPLPNPASQTVTINYALPAQSSDAVLEVMDPLSRKIISQPLNTILSQINLDVSRWDSGVYFYRIIHKQSSSEFKRMVIE